VLSTPSNSSGTLNPEAHEFKYKALTANLSKSDDEPNKKNAEIGINNKGKYNFLKTTNMIISLHIILFCNYMYLCMSI